MIAHLFYRLSINALFELGNLESEFFKSRAYKNAVYSIKDYVLNNSVQKFYDLSDYSILPKIGSGINSKLIELKSTGKIMKLDELRVNNLTELDSKLYKVRKGYITKRIPYQVAKSLYIELTKGWKTECAGSLRRKSELIGDIDILISNNDFNNFIESLIRNNYRVISRGEYKTSIMIDEVNNTQVDIISVTKEEFPYQLLYLTGSQSFNIELRRLAKEKGMKLNQYGLWYKDSDGNELSYMANSEIDIFNYLGINYVEPENR